MEEKPEKIMEKICGKDNISDTSIDIKEREEKDDGKKEEKIEEKKGYKRKLMPSQKQRNVSPRVMPQPDQYNRRRRSPPPPPPQPPSISSNSLNECRPSYQYNGKSDKSIYFKDREDEKIEYKKKLRPLRQGKSAMRPSVMAQPDQYNRPPPPQPPSVSNSSLYEGRPSYQYGGIVNGTIVLSRTENLQHLPHEEEQKRI